MCKRARTVLKSAAKSASERECGGSFGRLFCFLLQTKIKKKILGKAGRAGIR